MGAEPCALEFLVHFIGDIHQPLHVGWENDLGGNECDVTWFGKKTNLHSVWDTSILEKWTTSIPEALDYLHKYIKDHPDIEKQYLESTNPVSWAAESFTSVVKSVYDFPGTCASIPALGEEYYTQHIPIVQQRLIAAGLRLAHLFNTILAEKLKQTPILRNEVVV